MNRRNLLILVLLVSIALGIGLPTARSAPRGPLANATTPPVAAPIVGQQIAGPSYDPAMDAPPAPAEAVHRAASGWVTAYGTQLGHSSMPPQPAPLASIAMGPIPAVGFWNMVTAASGPVTALVEAPNRWIVAGTAANGLQIYSPNSSGVYTWSSITASAGGLISNAISSLAIYNTKLWIGTSSGISVYDLEAATWNSFTTSNSPLPSNTIRRLSVVRDANNFQTIWASTAAGAANYADFGGNWRVYTTTSGLIYPEVDDVATQIVGTTTYTWISTRRTPNGSADARGSIARWDGTSWAYFGETTTGGCAFDTARRIVVDQNQYVWFAAEDSYLGIDQTSGFVAKGVCRLIGTLPSSSWTPFTFNTLGLPSDNVRDLSLDQANRLWMGFASDGVHAGGAAVYEEGRWGIYTQANSGLQSNTVTVVQAIGESAWFAHGSNQISTYAPFWQRTLASSLGASGAPQAFLMEQNTLWVGIGTGLAWRDTTGWQYRAIPGNNSTITSLVRTSDGKLRIGTQGNGIWAWDGSSFGDQQTTLWQLPSNTIQAMTIDQSGRWWVATPNGLALRGNGYWMTFTPSNSALPELDVRALTVDLQGRLWIGTSANGIAIYDSSIPGDAAWSTERTTDGLPSNAIRVLTTDTAGRVWAGTTAGAADWQPSTGNWNISTVNQGLLPSDTVLSIGSDGKGTTLVGTDRGLALLSEAGNQILHVPGTSFSSDQIRAVAGDGERIWVGALSIAVRGVVPLGNLQPTISSFTSSTAAPETLITISGANFDDRDPAFNKVRFTSFDGIIDHVAGEVVAATTTALTVRVPLTAGTGALRVESYGLKSGYSSTFRVAPVITSINTTCLAIGSSIVVNGYGFLGASSGGITIKIGNGPPRSVDKATAVMIEHRIRPGDTAGPVVIRLNNGATAQSSTSIALATPQVVAVMAQQSVKNATMVWAKPTLIQVQLRSVGAACNAVIDGGLLEWVKTDGTTQTADYVRVGTSPDGLQITPTAPPVTDFNRMINFAARFDFNYPVFARNQLSALRITFFNRKFSLLTQEIPASQFNWIEVPVKHHIMNAEILPPDYSYEQYKGYTASVWDSFEQVERNFPLPPSSALWWDHETNWLYNWTGQIRSMSGVNLSSGDDFEKLISWMDDQREYANDVRCDVDGPCRPYIDQAIALVASELYASGTASGKARSVCDNPFSDCDHDSAVVFNLPGSMASIYLHELTHSLGAIRESSPNHHDDHSGKNLHHSKYEEGQNADPAECDQARTFRQALIDQTGTLPQVVRLDNGDPVQMLLVGCGDDTPAKSIMSYAPNMNDFNTFYEPLDVGFAYGQIGGGITLLARSPQAYTQTLRLNGTLDAQDTIAVSMAYLRDASGSVNESEPYGTYHLLIRSANGMVLLDHGFEISSNTAHDGPTATTRFNLRVPFPTGSVSAEIRRDLKVLWSTRLSARTPSAIFTAPAGGTLSANDTINVTWQATDTDRDALQASLDYSPDNGQSWLPIATRITTRSYAWQPRFVPPSSTARLRLTVSDGLRTATTMSALFSLTGARPMAVVTSPKPLEHFTEGQVIRLVGSSRTGLGAGSGSFAWRSNGVLIGTGAVISTTLNAVGLQSYQLTVTADGQQDSSSVTVIVDPDFDRDGIPNAAEFAHGLNPLDVTTGIVDLDGDGLNAWYEIRLGTDPRDGDTDNDGSTDGSELAAGTAPTLSAQVPPSRSILQVGPEHQVFRLAVNSRPVSNSFWITNRGPGRLSWAATSDAPWLTLSSSSGTTPHQQRYTISVDALAPGRYVGHITLIANALGSPHVITVELEVIEPRRAQVYGNYGPLIRR